MSETDETLRGDQREGLRGDQREGLRGGQREGLRPGRLDPDVLRGMAGPRQAWACRQCGHWQRWFPPGPPPSCPVDLDYRNALPDDGWAWATHEQLEGELSPRVDEPLPGVHEIGTSPRFGLDSVGWVLETEAGPVGWEAAPHYHSSTVEWMRARGGLVALGASHVHGFGALHQLQDELAPPVVAVGEPELVWTKAFRVTWPVDDRLDLAPGLVAHRSGGHFPGHLVLHDESRGILFCGDALKVDLDEGGAPVALSAHKAFHAQIPLSHGDVRRYRALVERLEFDVVCTPFEMAKGVTREDVLALCDVLLSGPPEAGPVPLSGLR